MKKTRRTFLQVTGTVAAGSLIIPSFACNSNKAAISSPIAKNKIDPFGIQLYTLRDDMVVDHKVVIQKLGSYGYKQIEGYEGEKGMFWGMTPMDYKSLLSDNGMKMVSAHCNVYEDFEAKAAAAASIGTFCLS